MLKFSREKPSNLQCDALAVEVNCLGRWNRDDPSAEIRAAFPEVAKAYRVAFDAGEVEPGRVLAVELPSGPPKHCFLLPLRVHPRGPSRPEYSKSCFAELVEQALRLGVTSLGLGARSFGFGAIEDGPKAARNEVKLRLLQSFARVPEIRLIGRLPQPSKGAGKPVTIFTDGGAEPNPGRGGFGVVLRFGDHAKELSGGFSQTSNNRMELWAAIAGLEALKHPCHVRLHSDSRYVVDAVNTGLLFRLSAKSWQAKKPTNVDLWQRFLKSYLQHDVEMVWVKGHAGIEDNERCDQLAELAMRGKDLQVDDGFSQSSRKTKKRSSPQPKLIPTASPQRTGPRPPRPKKPGDKCRQCDTPLIRREAKKHKPGAAYHFAWHLYCQNCHRMYQVEEAKVPVR